MQRLKPLDTTWLCFVNDLNRVDFDKKLQKLGLVDKDMQVTTKGEKTYWFVSFKHSWIFTREGIVFLPTLGDERFSMKQLQLIVQMAIDRTLPNVNELLRKGFDDETRNNRNT